MQSIIQITTLASITSLLCFIYIKSNQDSYIYLQMAGLQRCLSSATDLLQVARRAITEHCAGPVSVGSGWYLNSFHYSILFFFFLFFFLFYLLSFFVFFLIFFYYLFSYFLFSGFFSYFVSYLLFYFFLIFFLFFFLSFFIIFLFFNFNFF